MKWNETLDKKLQDKGAQIAVQQATDAEDTSRADAFKRDVLVPALQEFAEAMRHRGRTVQVVGTQITVKNAGGAIELDMYFELRDKRITPKEYFYPEKERNFSAQGTMRSGAQDYGFKDITHEEILEFLANRFNAKAS